MYSVRKKVKHCSGRWKIKSSKRTGQYAGPEAGGVGV